MVQLDHYRETSVRIRRPALASAADTEPDICGAGGVRVGYTPAGRQGALSSCVRQGSPASCLTLSVAWSRVIPDRSSGWGGTASGWSIGWLRPCIEH